MEKQYQRLEVVATSRVSHSTQIHLNGNPDRLNKMSETIVYVRGYIIITL